MSPWVAPAPFQMGEPRTSANMRLPIHGPRFQPSRGRTTAVPPLLLTLILALTHAIVPELGAAIVSKVIHMGDMDAMTMPEASGMTASRLNPGFLWVHNDEDPGDSAIYAVTTNGTLRAFLQTQFSGGDYEDIAVGPGPLPGVQYIYLGDIGDNMRDRTNGVRVIRIVEPIVPLQAFAVPPKLDVQEAAQITLIYPDGLHNAEALLSDPITGDLFIVPKIEDSDYSGIYRAPKQAMDTNNVVQLEFLGYVPLRNAAGGDISADGSEIIIRRKNRADIWSRRPNQTVDQALRRPGRRTSIVGEPDEPNGEAITFDPLGLGYYSSSESFYRPESTNEMGMTLPELLIEPPIFFYEYGRPPRYDQLLRQARLETRVNLFLLGTYQPDPGQRPMRLRIGTRELTQAINEDLDLPLDPRRPSSLYQIISPAGAGRMVMRQPRQPDVDVTDYILAMDLGNDHPDAVIVQPNPRAPARITTVAEWMFQLGTPDMRISVAGMARNMIRSTRTSWLSGYSYRDVAQSIARVEGDLLDNGMPTYHLKGMVMLIGARAASLFGYLVEDFDKDDGQFMVTQNGPAQGAWQYRQPTAEAPDGAWLARGTHQQGVPASANLITRPFRVTSSGEVALVFEHRHHFQADGGLNQDGGLIRVRINNQPFADLPPEAFTIHGYTGLLTTGGSLNQHPAFTGMSPGYADGGTLLSEAVLGRVEAGDMIMIQFIGSWDGSGNGGDPNWEIDNVAVVNW